MTGVTAIPSPAGGAASADIFNGQTPSLSSLNLQRIATVADRLFMALDSSGHNGHPMDLFQLCLALARGIDYAVANNDVPFKAQELPILLKKICQRKNDHVLQAAIMALMISVKIACKLEWFTNNDTEELLTLANEIGSTFCSQGNAYSEPSLSLPTVVNVMARFCPQMKTGQILASLEVNPGYGAYLIDFHITKNQSFSPKDKIRLFVAQTDSVETSSCLISPPQANFLLNGKGVEKRTNVLMDTRPQIPTDVTSLLKYGTNLLQVVGQFNGHYLIVVAFMNLTSIPETPVLPDYVQPAVAAQDADAEIIEGRSRISLNCPISCKRIKTPAKGQSCKHLQSFDLHNFLNLNTRTLSWRCPHCGQSTCYLDIRIDQYMVKVLREVGENVADVIIFEDGSWKAGSERNDHVDQPSEKSFSFHQDGSEPQETTSCLDALPLVFDLTEGDDEADFMRFCEIVDRKPFQANPQSHSIHVTLHKQSEMNNVSQIINEDSTPQIENDFGSGIFLSTHSSMSSSTRFDAQNVGGIAEPFLASNMISPVLYNAVPSALSREPEELRGNTPSVWQSQFSAPLTLQLQQSQVEHSIMSNEYGRPPSIPRHVSRTPIAIQALPAQSLQSVPQQRSRTSLNSLTPNGSSVIPTGDGFNTISIDYEGRQQFSRTLTSPMQVPEMASSSLQQRSMAQNWDHQDHLFIPSQSVQQVVGLPAPNRLPGPYRQSSEVRTQHQNSHQQLAVNQIIPPNISQPPTVMTRRTPPHLQWNRIEQVGTQAGVGHTAVSGKPPFMGASWQAIQMTSQSQHSPVQIQTPQTGASPTVNENGLRASVGEQRENVGGTLQPVTTAEDLLNISSERNWQPTGRMRGSLSGQAYSEALSQFMTRPAQPSQATRPPGNPTSLPSGAPPQLQVLLANNRNANASQTHNYSTGEADSMIGSSDALPDQSS